MVRALRRPGFTTPTRALVPLTRRAVGLARDVGDRRAVCHVAAGKRHLAEALGDVLLLLAWPGAVGELHAPAVGPRAGHHLASLSIDPCEAILLHGLGALGFAGARLCRRRGGNGRDAQACGGGEEKCSSHVHWTAWHGRIFRVRCAAPACDVTGACAHPPPLPSSRRLVDRDDLLTQPLDTLLDRWPRRAGAGGGLGRRGGCGDGRRVGRDDRPGIARHLAGRRVRAAQAEALAPRGGARPRGRRGFRAGRAGAPRARGWCPGKGRHAGSELDRAADVPLEITRAAADAVSLAADAALNGDPDHRADAVAACMMAEGARAPPPT